MFEDSESKLGENQVSKIRKEPTPFELLERLEEVRQEYRAFLNELESNQHLDSSDGRVAFINNTLSFLRTGAVTFNIYHHCGLNDQFAQIMFCLESPDIIEKNIKSMNKFIKLSWCTQFQFQIEVTFKNILKELEESVPDGYYKISRKLLNVLHITDRKQRIKVLNIIAYIRNSQHTNGIHLAYNGQDSIIQVDGIPFEFKHGKMVKCATWDHIAHACVNILPIIREIYYHDKVVNIPRVQNFYNP